MIPVSSQIYHRDGGLWYIMTNEGLRVYNGSAGGWQESIRSIAQFEYELVRGFIQPVSHVGALPGDVDPDLEVDEGF